MARNIVLICLDSVRWDYFRQYATQLMDRADVVFEQCRAASSWSVPSHASMFTGVLPSRHGVHSHNFDFSTISKKDTFFESLPSYEILGISANSFVSSTFGFSDSYDRFVDTDPINRFPEGLDVRTLDQTSISSQILGLLKELYTHDYPVKSLSNAILAQINSLSRALPIPQLLDSGARVVSRQMAALASSAIEPFFLFGNFMDAHGPLTPTRQFDSAIYSVPLTWNSPDHIDAWEINQANDLESYEQQLKYYRELYGAAIDYLDRTVVKLINTINRDTTHDTTFIITSDHGENLGYDADERLFSHVSSLSESLLHVPFLLVNPPSGYEATEGGYFSHLDLGTLIAGFAEDTSPDVFRDEVVAERIGIGSMNPDFDDETYRYWDRMLRCAYSGPEKFVWDSLGNVEKYRLDLDRPCYQSRCDDLTAKPAWVDQFFETDIQAYKRQAAAGDGDRDIDESTEARLKNLGYL